MAIFSIFQHGGRRHLGFKKISTVGVYRNGQERQTVSLCQISIFQDGRRHVGFVK